MEMKQIELELAYVGYVKKKKKITDGLHVIKLCQETCLQHFEWDGGLCGWKRRINDSSFKAKIISY